MATTPAERLGAVWNNRDRAKKTFEASPDDTALEANADKAQKALVDSIANGLTANGPAMETAVERLKSANDEAKDALQTAKTAAAILGALQKATELAIKVAAIV